MKHVAHEWETFRRTVLVPCGASEIQTREMRRAFYAGAQAILLKLTNLFDANGSDEPTPADLAVMESVVAELKEFFDAMQTGGVAEA